MKRFPFWPDWYIEDEKKDLLGAGSFGRVYKIRRDDLGLQTVCALKVIRVPQDNSEVEELRDRSMDDRSIAAYYAQTAQGIAEEIKLLLTLKYCPNIVRIEDYHLEKNEDGFGFTVYIRMPLLENLEDRARARFKNGQPFTPEEVIRIGSDICDALTACEKKNIIHRDIKPGNIFIDEDGTYILGDFGIARQMDSSTQSMHSQKGTMNYMAPEILRGERGYDRSVDYYSLGTMLYRYLNHNRFPYEPRFPRPITPMDSSEVLAKRLSGAEVELPDDASPALGEAIRRACAPDPKDRYRSAAEMKQAILQGAAGGPAVNPSYARPDEAEEESTLGAMGIDPAGKYGATGGSAPAAAGAAGTYFAWNTDPASAEVTAGDSTVSAVDSDLWAAEQKRREEEKARREAEEKAREERRKRQEERRKRQAEARKRQEEARKRREEAQKEQAPGEESDHTEQKPEARKWYKMLIIICTAVYLFSMVLMVLHERLDFYNRIEAATFIGACSVPLLGLLLIHLRKIPFLSVSILTIFFMYVGRFGAMCAYVTIFDDHYISNPMIGATMALVGIVLTILLPYCAYRWLNENDARRRG